MDDALMDDTKATDCLYNQDTTEEKIKVLFLHNIYMSNVTSFISVKIPNQKRLVFNFYTPQHNSGGV